MVDFRGIIKFACGRNSVTACKQLNIQSDHDKKTAAWR